MRRKVNSDLSENLSSQSLLCVRSALTVILEQVTALLNFFHLFVLGDTCMHMHVFFVNGHACVCAHTLAYVHMVEAEHNHIRTTTKGATYLFSKRSIYLFKKWANRFVPAMKKLFFASSSNETCTLKNPTSHQAVNGGAHSY